MTEEMKRELAAVKIDLKSAIERFVDNEDLFEKMLRKFPSDENFNGLKAALAKSDYEAAISCVHTLKGISGNFSMIELFDLSVEVLTALRGGDYEKAKAVFPQLEEMYNKICQVIVDN